MVEDSDLIVSDEHEFNALMEILESTAPPLDDLREIRRNCFKLLHESRSNNSQTVALLEELAKKADYADKVLYEFRRDLKEIRWMTER